MKKIGFANFWQGILPLFKNTLTKSIFVKSSADLDSRKYLARFLVFLTVRNDSTIRYQI
jgi:hypothetical protein